MSIKNDKRSSVFKTRRINDDEIQMIDAFAEKDYSDDYDIIKSLQTVYDKRKFSLNENFVLMIGSDDKLREFVARQHMTAIKFYNMIPDKKYARMAYDLIVSELNDRAIMKRNIKGNLIVEGIINRGGSGNITDKIEEKPEEGFLGRQKSKIKRIIAPDNKVKEEEKGVLN